MNSHERGRDIFEALQEGDPALGHDPDQDAVLRQTIKARVLTSGRRPLRATRHKILVAALLVATVLVTTAATLYLTREPSDPRGVACYQAESLHAPQFIVGSPLSLHPSECAPLWNDSTLTNPDVASPGEVPQLIGCVTDAGGLAVFPSDDDRLCERLGLAGYVQPARSDTIDLNLQLVGLFSTSSCMTISDAQVRIEDIFTNLGLDDWTVTITTPATPQRPCASFSLQVDDRTVLLVPIPHPSGE